MQAPKSKYSKPRYVDGSQIIDSSLIEEKQNKLVEILTTYISNAANKQKTITNLETLRISIDKISNTR